jgi:hypothetical protein
MATTDTALYSTPMLLGRGEDLPDRLSPRCSLSYYLRQLWARQWRSGGRPPLPPAEEPASGNPWDDPALWMLMFH